MQLSIQPTRSSWAALQQRPAQAENETVLSRVRSIMADVKANGDEAIVRYNQQLDKHENSNLLVNEAEIASAADAIPQPLKRAIQTAIDNLTTFHKPQLQEPVQIETMPGVVCWRKSIGIEKVGLYIPGGTAPLFSTVLMLGVPAKLAGCKEVVLCTPGGKNGLVNPAILYAASQVGISKVYRIGGAQAIAAMAYGTASVPAIYKLFGPGNQYVTAAKQLASTQGIAIDMPAGPSEVLVWADDKANPAWVAADLLSQAEHGVDSQVILVCDSEQFALDVKAQVLKLLSKLDREHLAKEALNHSRLVVLPEQEQALEFVNSYAAEHLIIARENALDLASLITNAGSVFLGYYSPESAGDYASGTNHTLPTYGHARAYSGVSVDSFVKKVTFQHLSPAGLANIGPAVATMAVAEHLDAHALAVNIRLQQS